MLISSIHERFFYTIIHTKNQIEKYNLAKNFNI